ncbi:hypothetical protein [Cohnella sp. REN36]|uniref:hypothetical protein n=1 Tax=Cohnella sp. REN36 TaxID=2887347 RepID=UPI001D15C262|nr:hypothetical protein [Cohnella sp. REN36]MCC3375910.1 hypothetical protein [Cohnella sp. REN36]
MRVPSFERYRGSMQAIAFFLCGLIVGAAVYSALVLDQSNRIVQQNYELKEQVELIRQELERPQKPQEAAFTSLVLYLVDPVDKSKEEPPLDTVTEKELKKRLRDDLHIFLGRKIYDIGSDAQLARSLIEGRVYPDIEKKDYIVSIRTVLAVDRRLTVWVEARTMVR